MDGTITFIKLDKNYLDILKQWWHSDRVKQFWDNSPKMEEDVDNYALKGQKTFYDYYIGLYDGVPYALVMTSEQTNDDYYEYYDMYATTSITIDKVLSREEVINKVLAKSDLSIYRFISTGFTLTEEEVKIFQEKCKDDKTIQAYIDYYVNKNEDAFSLKKKM